MLKNSKPLRWVIWQIDLLRQAIRQNNNSQYICYGCTPLQPIENTCGFPAIQNRIGALS